MSSRPRAANDAASPVADHAAGHGEGRGDFTFRVRVYWEDTDAGGIVFYANYIKYFERARTEWLRELGYGQEALRRAGAGMFVVGDTSVRYLQPARLDDELDITARVLVKGRTSLTFMQRALRAGEVLCEGQIRVGWVEPQPQHGALRARRIPADMWSRIPGATESES